MRNEFKSHYPNLAQAYAIEEAQDAAEGFNMLRYGVYRIGRTMPDIPVHHELTHAADELLKEDQERELEVVRPITSEEYLRNSMIDEVASQFGRICTASVTKQADLEKKYQTAQSGLCLLEEVLTSSEISAVSRVLTGPAERMLTEKKDEEVKRQQAKAEENRLINRLKRVREPHVAYSAVIRRSVAAEPRPANSEADDVEQEDPIGIYAGTSVTRAEKQLLRLVEGGHDIGSNTQPVVFESELISLLDPELAAHDRPAAQAKLRDMYTSIRSKVRSAEPTLLEKQGATSRVGLRRGKVYPINNQGQRTSHLPAKTVYGLVDAVDIHKQRFSIEGQMHECIWEKDADARRGQNGSDNESQHTVLWQQAIERRKSSIALANFCLRTLQIRLDDIAKYDEDQAVISSISDETTRLAALDAHGTVQDAVAKEVYELIQTADLDRIRQEIHDIKEATSQTPSLNALLERDEVMRHASLIGEYAPSIADRIVKRAQQLCEEYFNTTKDTPKLQGEVAQQLEELENLEKALASDLPVTWLSLKLKELARNEPPKVIVGTTIEKYNVNLQEKAPLDPVDIMDTLTSPVGNIVDRIGEYFRVCQEYPINIKSLTQLVYGSGLNVSLKDRNRVRNYVSPSAKSLYEQVVKLLSIDEVVLQRGSIINDPETDSPKNTRILRSFHVETFAPEVHTGSSYVNGVLHNWEDIPEQQIKAAKKLND